MKTVTEIMELATQLGDRRLLVTHGMGSKDDVAMSYAALKAAVENLIAVNADLLAFAQRVCHGDGDSVQTLHRQGMAAIRKATGETA